jgi:hypothetical protein
MKFKDAGYKVLLAPQAVPELGEVGGGEGLARHAAPCAAAAGCGPTAGARLALRPALAWPGPA